MKNKKGFTLLELLVVVLIIGILAAIALPQYKFAVLKSKFAKVKSNVQALVSSMQRYYLANNHYPQSLDDLDIELKDKDDEQYYTNSGLYTNNGDVGGLIKRNEANILNYYFILDGADHYDNDNIKNNSYYCIAYDGLEGNQNISDILIKICQQETSKTEHIRKNNIYTWYAY